MIRCTSLVAVLFFAGTNAAAQPQFELSRNVYRVPYANGTDVHVTNDHYTHSPVGRYDMSGTGNGSSCSGNYRIVAAAEGIIRKIVDNHGLVGSETDCDVVNCADFNNYVWIEHANGEWTKYSHMARNSTRVAAGLSVGDQVCAGTFLGYECEIGQASGPHLHFEVRAPFDTTAPPAISVDGGFMNNDVAAHRVPVFNTIGKHFMEGGDDITAGSSGGCSTISAYSLSIPYAVLSTGINIKMATSTITTLPGTPIKYLSGSNGLYQAGSRIILSPGFQAAQGCYFEARIAGCGTTNLTGTCQ
jgi:Peptidase family M23